MRTDGWDTLGLRDRGDSPGAEWSASRRGQGGRRTIHPVLVRWSRITRKMNHKVPDYLILCLSGTSKIFIPELTIITRIILDFFFFLGLLQTTETSRPYKDRREEAYRLED